MRLVRISIGRLSGNAPSHLVLRATLAAAKPARFDLADGGTGTISGVVSIENIPGARQVRLYKKQDGRLIREVWSTPAGAYEFANIAASGEYFVVAHDHLRVHNGVIQDMLTP